MARSAKFPRHAKTRAWKSIGTMLRASRFSLYQKFASLPSPRNGRGRLFGRITVSALETKLRAGHDLGNQRGKARIFLEIGRHFFQERAVGNLFGATEGVSKELGAKRAFKLFLILAKIF